MLRWITPSLLLVAAIIIIMVSVVEVESEWPHTTVSITRSCRLLLATYRSENKRKTSKRERERKRRNIRPDGGRRGRRDRDLPGRQLVVSTHCHPSRVLTPFSVYISRLNEWFFFFFFYFSKLYHDVFFLVTVVVSFPWQTVRS